MSNSDIKLNWSQQRTLDGIKPEDIEAARQSYRDAVDRYREEVLRESNINGRRRLITDIRQTLSQCPFQESTEDMRQLCVDLEAQIKSDQEKI